MDRSGSYWQRFVSKATSKRINKSYYIFPYHTCFRYRPDLFTTTPFIPPFLRLSTILFAQLRILVSFRPSQSIFACQPRLFHIKLFYQTRFRYGPDRSTPLQFIPPSFRDSKIWNSLLLPVFVVLTFSLFSTTFHVHLFSYFWFLCPASPSFPISVLYPSSPTLSVPSSHPLSYYSTAFLRTLASAFSTPSPNVLILKFSKFPCHTSIMLLSFLYFIAAVLTADCILSTDKFSYCAHFVTSYGTNTHYFYHSHAR